MRINGFPVVNATKPIVLKITPRDVAAGKTKDRNACAAAKACLREIAGCTDVRVHLSRTYVKVGNKWHRYATTRAIRQEIIAFDRGGNFEPGEYMLGQGYQATGKQTGSRTSQTRSKRLHKRRASPHHVTGVRQMHARGRSQS
jgi:hypothetical protein